MKKISLLVLAILLSAILSGSAYADWSQKFYQSSTENYNGSPVGLFDEIKIWWKSGSKFSSAGAFSGFTDPGWNINNVSDTSAYAVKPGGSNYTSFNITFAGLRTAGSEFWGAVLYNGAVKERQILSFSGFNWSYPTVTAAQWDASGGPNINIVPEPIGAALFIIGAGALGIIRSRRNKKKA